MTKNHSLLSPPFVVRRLFLLSASLLWWLQGPSALAVAGPAREPAPDPGAAARALVRRVLPRQAAHFQVEVIPADPAGDVFELESREGRIILRGNSGVSVASALNWYLKYYCQCHHSVTGGSQLQLPDPLPEVTPKVRRLSASTHRYFLNYCCFGYSLPWFHWPRWEQLIDWMAMNGINRPLAITGQEAVWQTVGRRLGWGDEAVRQFLAGPPYLPFGWMGCLDGHGGPLPQSWIDRHVDLQRKILARQRSLGMTPVLQGFTGHVPLVVTNRASGVKLQKITWAEWDTYLLDPLDPAFAQIASVFLEEQTKLFGTDHYYAADTFIEMIPPKGDSDYLAGIGRAIYEGMHGTDSQAVWVLQGWPFFFGRDFWTQTRIAAVLGAVPDSRILLLDLYCENTPVWSRTEAFCGKPWLWCNIQNFGDRVFLGGALPRINQDLFAARQHPQAGRLAGLGFVNEGLDHNPVVFDFLLEMAWRQEPVDLTSWLRDFCRRSYGRPNVPAGKAWQILQQTVLTASFDNLAACTVLPSLNPPPGVPYGNDRLAKAWELLLSASDDLGQADPYRFDLVNVARQVLGNLSADRHREITAAFERKDCQQVQQASARMFELIGDLDELLATRKEFLLGGWLEDAKDWGETRSERDRLEWNARRVLTLWGNRTTLRDYSCRQWAGLLNGFYRARWELFTTHLLRALDAGRPFDAEAFARDVFAWEQAWADRRDPHPRRPQGNSVKVARRLWHKYGSAFTL